MGRPGPEPSEEPLSPEPRVTSSGVRTTGRVRRLFDRRDGIRDLVAAQADTVDEPQGGASLLIVAEGDTPLLHEVK